MKRARLDHNNQIQNRASEEERLEVGGINLGTAQSDILGLKCICDFCYQQVQYGGYLDHVNSCDFNPINIEKCGNCGIPKRNHNCRDFVRSLEARIRELDNNNVELANQMKEYEKQNSVLKEVNQRLRMINQAQLTMKNSHSDHYSLPTIVSQNEADFNERTIPTGTSTETSLDQLREKLESCPSYALFRQEIGYNASENSCGDNNLPLLSDTASYHEEPVSPEIGIIKKFVNVGCQQVAQQKEIGIGSGNITTNEIGIQWEIPQLVVQNDIGCQYIEPVLQTNEPMNIKVLDEQQVDLLADCNMAWDEVLIDSYISDITNHQTLTHMGKLYKYVLVQKDNLKVLSYGERTKLINDWITPNIVDERNSFYSCEIHCGECKFVNIKTRSKSNVNNHVQSYLMYMICILCKEKVLHRPGFAQHIQYKHKNQ